MTCTENVLLATLRASTLGMPLDIDLMLSAIEWKDLLNLAREHGILPLTYDVVYHCKSFKLLDKSSRKNLQEISVKQAIRQIIQTNEFLTLLLRAQKQGLDPIVLKGVTVRKMYPQPCLRPSIDEDLLIRPEDITSWHSFLLSEGLFADEPEADLNAASELSYHKDDSPTYIELHKSLFDSKADAYGDFNILFPDLFSHTMRVQIEDVSVCTLEPTYHFLYLVLHAFKHFVHSGIGIRPVCDIGIFAEHYADEINWTYIRESLEKVNAFIYCKALLGIIQNHLLPDAHFFRHITDWHLEKIKVEPLLNDILAGGVHGNASMARLHSSNITLQAVTNHKKNQDVKSGAFRRMLFPPAKKLESRYPYLKKCPALLPIAWIQRGTHYLSEKRNNSIVSDAAESIRLGEQRIKLLEQYGIIK